MYVIHKANGMSEPEPDWRSPFWCDAETLTVDHFRPEGSNHRPVTNAKLVYDADGIHGIFRVEDQFVRCVHRRFQSEVWKDSCVEFFVQPVPGKGYMNFEFNCGGAFLSSYILDNERVPGGFKNFKLVSEELGRRIRVHPSLPRRVEPELVEPVTWRLRFFIPFSLFERYIGKLGPIQGQEWRGNFYKCAEDNSHPHWGAWAPVEKVDFHRPDLFGIVRFA